MVVIAAVLLLIRIKAHDKGDQEVGPEHKRERKLKYVQCSPFDMAARRRHERYRYQPRNYEQSDNQQ